MNRNKKVENKADDKPVDTQYRKDMTKEEFEAYLEYKLTEGMSAKNKALIKKYEGEDIDD